MKLENTAVRWLWAFLLIFVCLRFVSMGWYPLMDTTEARYADVARRMVERGDWVTLWFSDTEPFWGKPPLSFWVSALGFKLFGVSEWSARLPHFLMSLCVAALVAYQAWQKSARACLHTLVLLFGAILFAAASAAVMTDMSLTWGVTLVMVGFWQYFNDDSKRSQWFWFACMALGWSIGFLSKGPLMLVLSGVPLVLWTLWQRQWLQVWREIPWFWGLLLVLALTLPWYLWAEQRTPGFLNYFLLGEHWQRFVETGWAGDKYGVAHAETRGEIWLDAWVAMTPWTVLVPLWALWAWRKKSTSTRQAQTQAPNAQHDFSLSRSEIGYGLIWGLWPCVFFTLSGNILWTYVLPGIPALALLLAAWSSRQRGYVSEWILALGLGVCMTVMGIYIVQCRDGEYSFNKVTKATVLDYLALAQHDEPLYFLGAMPFSGSFYSSGKAQVFTDWSVLPDRAFVVIQDDDVSQWPQQLRDHLVLQTQHGGRQLFLWSRN